MNTTFPPRLPRLGIALVLSLSCPGLVLAQGSLTPPGAPAPLMKSLDQIEPRTPVDAAHTPGNSSEEFIISQPGSYYLTTNIVGLSGADGIEITANNVTLDLNGFSLLGTAVSRNGIYCQGHGVVVRNGTIKSWGSLGIEDLVSSTPARVFEKLTVSSNAVYGIETSQGAIIQDCVIEANVGFGIYATGASRISGCIVDGNGSGGIAIEPPGACVVVNNFAFGNDTNDHFGEIYMNSPNNHIEGNRAIVTSPTGNGIYIFSESFNTNNVIVKNDVAGGGTRNFTLISGNDVGPIGSATNSTSPWANISH
ncbi:MAG TPA: right-handed parallel beta-helix repeat-containing protein [Verrucomicrobiae bacterium]|nr:right-handed parallel beta-helix repeat-containing protein [Verrucomicrobiae bacterium]